MSKVPAWADLQYQRNILRLKQITVAVFFLGMIILADRDVHQRAQKIGRIKEPTMVDRVLFRRIVYDGDWGLVTLFGTYD